MWQVVGQGRALAFLERSLARGAMPHALLLVGPPQAGKRTLALNLAQALNCQGQAPPCGSCAACRRIAAGLHADVRVIGMPGEGAEIGIDRIREVQQAASLKPFEGRCRVFIIDGAEKLSSEAANCLLKTLEEPPPQVVLALLAVEAGALPPTLLSRCQRVEVAPLAPAVAQELLETRWGVAPERARLLARLSGGRLGWALAALEQKENGLARYLEERTRLAGMAGRERALALAEELASRFRRGREEVLESLRLWQSWWRDLLLVKGGSPQFITHIDAEPELRRQAQALSLGQIRDFLQALARAGEDLRLNANPQLALEVLMLSLPLTMETA